MCVGEGGGVATAAMQPSEPSRYIVDATRFTSGMGSKLARLLTDQEMTIDARSKISSPSLCHRSSMGRLRHRLPSLPVEAILRPVPADQRPEEEEAVHPVVEQLTERWPWPCRRLRDLVAGR